jgi:thiamine biosynthesis protein ThiI
VAWDGVLVRFGEIGIKSAPVRRQMLQRLRQNIEDSLLRRRIEGHVAAYSSRIWMTGGGAGGADALVDVAIHTMGVVSASPCVVVHSDMETMGKAAAELALAREWTSFAVRADRTGEHTFSSNDVGREVGSAIYVAAEAAGRAPKVDLSNPDLAVHADVRDDKAWLFVDKIAGAGGLPVGSQGKVVALLSDTASAISAWMMMRRGCTVIPVHAGDMGSSPLEILEPIWAWGLPEDITLLPVCSGTVAKRTLLDTAVMIAHETGAQAVVTGDKLDSHLDMVEGETILRPVCGLDPEELARWQQRIGLPDFDGESIWDDASSETVESLLSMRRVVSA